MALKLIKYHHYVGNTIFFYQQLNKRQLFLLISSRLVRYFKYLQLTVILCQAFHIYNEDGKYYHFKIITMKGPTLIEMFQNP